MPALIQPPKSAAPTSAQPKGPDTPTGHTEIRVKGQAVSVPSVRIDGRTVIATGKWLKIAAVQDEDLVDGEVVADPVSFVLLLKRTALKADIFTFPQKLPDITPRF